jgi:ATP-dependent exoDNAse (exonuclease V) beta subunit
MAFNVYKSSAGSGKTYTLVREYIQLCLADENPQNFKSILAITFTNKAAAEMKDRVFTALKKISSNDPSIEHLQSELVNNLSIEKPILQKRAKNVLTAMLHQYGSVSISTIDKFVHKIVKSFSRDLNLPSDFEIELDAKKILKEAIEIVLSKIGKDEKITKLLYEFTESRANEEDNWNIEAILERFALHLLNDEALFHLKNFSDLSIDDFMQIREKIQREIELITTKAKSIGEGGTMLIKKAGVPDKSTQYAGSVRKFFVKFLDRNIGDAEIATTQVTGIAESGRHWSKSAPVADQSALDGITPQLNTLIFSGLDFVKKDLRELIMLKSVSDAVFPMALLNEINQAMLQIREEKSLVHISEFNKMIAEVVSNEPAPFIYERLGEKYNHFLIDEFQDTSVTQFQNLLPLIENSLATGGYNMLVGDAKQSIYRWRGGEVEQFVSLPKLIHKDDNEFNLEREESLIRNYQEFNLQKNFRSQKQIIEFNNLFFDIEKKRNPDLLSNLYQQHEQLFDSRLDQGFVQMKLIDTKEMSQDEYVIANCNYVLEKINLLLQNGYSYSDVACIFRNNKQASIVASFLSENHIPVLSRESLLIQNSADVNFLVSSLQLLVRPYQQQAKVILASYLNHRKAKNIAFDEQTTQLLYSLDFSGIFNRYNLLIDANHLQQLPMFEIVEKLVKLVGLDEDNNAFVSYFLDYVLAFSQKPNSNLQALLNDWDLVKSKMSVSVPEGLNAVNILTIHKSKGLEFPIVIFPFANWKNVNDSFVWQKINFTSIPELKVALIKLNKKFEQTEFNNAYATESKGKYIDDMNLLYVTFTRAKKQLYVFADLPSGGKKLSEIYVNFIKTVKSTDAPSDCYEMGVFAPSTDSEKKNEVQVVPIHYQIVDWRNKIELV